MNILIVEDNSDVSHVLTITFRRADHTAITVISGEAAIETLKQDVQIDGLITDVNLAGKMNGIELAKHARAIKPNLPICIMSGLPLEEIRRKFGNTPFDHFVSKPFERTVFNPFFALIARANPKT